LNKTKEEVEFSILLPAYNEAARIEKCVQMVKKTIETLSPSYELIISEDGSTDGTDMIVARMAENDSKIKSLHSTARLGKGKAIKKALRIAKGDVVIFLDVDLATKLEYLPKIAEVATTQRGIVIGSRHSVGSKVYRPISRKLSSLTYNFFVRALFRDGVRDHQCGFKALSRELVSALKDKIESDGFFIDTEILLRTKKMGFPITEIGVEWIEPRKKGESKVRVLRDAWKMSVTLLKFRLGKTVSTHSPF
jgi:glycosyltransferase involved in cell wall biosynthesis